MLSVVNAERGVWTSPSGVSFWRLRCIFVEGRDCNTATAAAIGSMNVEEISVRDNLCKKYRNMKRDSRK